MAINSFGQLNNSQFKTPGLGRVPLPPVSPARPPVTTPVNNFQSQPNFKQVMPSNLGINGQPQMGNISLGQTYGNIVKGGLNAAAKTFVPGYAAYQTYNSAQNNTPSAQSSQPAQQSPARPPMGVNVAQAASPTYQPPSSGNGGSPWQPTADQYGNQFGGYSGNVVPTQAPVAPGMNTQPMPDRFAQLNALRDSAASYFQPTQDEQDTMQQYGNLLGSRDLGLAKINNNPEPMDLITGQSAYLQKQAEAQAQPLQAKLGILQARRQAAIQGYQAALGAEQTKLGYQQPVSLGIGQGLYSPTNGQQIGGNSTLGSSGSNSLIGSLADSVLNGTAYDDALKQLPSAALSPALFNELKRRDPNFNITQSNQNALARATQLNNNVTITQPLKLAMNTALDHIKGLQEIVDKVNYSDIPIWNRIKSTYGTQVSSNEDVRTLNSQIGLVREEVAKVLGGGTATDSARADANAIIPDNLSPGQFRKVIGQVQERMQEKIDEYSKLSNPAQYGNQTADSSSGGTMWDF